MRPIAQTIFKTVPVPLDTHGDAIIPFSIGLHTIHCLGGIVHDRPAYHNKRYIMPVGYHSSRLYLSTINSEAQTIYHNRIKDGGRCPYSR